MSLAFLTASTVPGPGPTVGVDGVAGFGFGGFWALAWLAVAMTTASEANHPIEFQLSRRM